MMTMQTFADAEAALSAALPNYESRYPQQVGAQAVEKAIANRSHVIIQAGCGVGKSFMGLIPAILSGQRTIVSTATKALQGQLTQKDLPFLQEHLIPFSWTMLQGRGNYLCLNRANLVVEDPGVREIIEVASREGFTGLREDLGFEVPNEIWGKVASDSEECNDLHCKERGGCFAVRARQVAQDCQIVVVNHALLCTDLMVKSQSEGWVTMLGEYDLAILDELHEFESYAKGSLGRSFSEGSIISLLDQVRSFIRKTNFRQDQIAKIDEAATTINNAVSFLWMAFSVMMKEKSSTLRLRPENFTEYEDEWVGLATALSTYESLLVSISGPTDSTEAKRWTMLRKRATRLANSFALLILDRQDQSVRWLEVQRRKGGRSVTVINSRPLQVADFLAEHLFSQATVIGMSATSKIGNDFDFIAKRLGFGDYDGVDVGTMFDYSTQAVLYVPKGFPSPAGSTRSQWEAVAPQEILRLVKASRGRALLLFTSYAAMERAYDLIAPEIDWTCLKQGDAPVPVLAKQFAEDMDSVLFATRSFMTGMDVQGESLSLVVLDKLVFTSPEDPTFEAESEVIEARGGSSFAELAMPMMQLVTEQAAGRLIRTQKDRGVFAILDSRLVDKGYGKRVVRALPPMAFTDNIRTVTEFFAA